MPVLCPRLLFAWRQCRSGAAGGGLLLLVLSATLQGVQAQLLLNGYTFSRPQGTSTSSSSQSVGRSVSRVRGDSCSAQLQEFYSQQGLANAADQGCITSLDNVIALPLVPGQTEQYQIVDNQRKFGVAEQTVSSFSDATTHQKSVTGFTGMGYSVFLQPVPNQPQN
ncbi:MAG: hypothetical protein ACKOCM_00840 [Cyanobacteriota bacterium]